jgi:hypothetical protein
MVRILDLSYFAKDNKNGELLPQAGWRDFTYRDHRKPYIPNQTGSEVVTTPNNSSTHPPPSPRLKNFHKTRDLPAGAICRVIAACKNIRFANPTVPTSSKAEANPHLHSKINISRLQLTIDYLFVDPAFTSHRSDYAFTYTSDLPTTCTARVSCAGYSSRPRSGSSLSPPGTGDVRLTAITMDAIIFDLRTLNHLEEVKAKDFLWLTGDKIKVLLEGCKGLRCVDFRGSGMDRNSRWAVQGSREEVLKMVE